MNNIEQELEETLDRVKLMTEKAEKLRKEVLDISSKALNEALENDIEPHHRILVSEALKLMSKGSDADLNEIIAILKKLQSETERDENSSGGNK